MLFWFFAVCFSLIQWASLTSTSSKSDISQSDGIEVIRTAVKGLDVASHVTNSAIGDLRLHVQDNCNQLALLDNTVSDSLNSIKESVARTEWIVRDLEQSMNGKLTVVQTYMRSIAARSLAASQAMTELLAKVEAFSDQMPGLVSFCQLSSALISVCGCRLNCPLIIGHSALSWKRLCSRIPSSRPILPPAPSTRCECCTQRQTYALGPAMPLSVKQRPRDMPLLILGTGVPTEPTTGAAAPRGLQVPWGHPQTEQNRTGSVSSHVRPSSWAFQPCLRRVYNRRWPPRYLPPIYKYCARGTEPCHPGTVSSI